MFKVLSIWCSTPIESFFPLLKTVFKVTDMPFSASAIFCFTYSTLAKRFPWRTFFIGGNKKKTHSSWDQVNRGSCWFWWKTAEHSVWCGWLVNHPSQNRQIRWKSFPKQFTEAKCSLSQQCQLVHWYRWVPRTLTWRRKSVLQGACPPEDNSWLFWVPPRMSVPSVLHT